MIHSSTTSYQPIENYGLIGDMRSAAMVGMNGSIDWLCLPWFDAPSVFGALLDAEAGGRFCIEPEGSFAARQIYHPDTNVLVTRFTGEDGAMEIVDYMPVDPPGGDEPGGSVTIGLNGSAREWGDRPSWVIRRVEVLRGEVTVNMACRPAFDYARAEHVLEVLEGGAVFESETGFALGLLTEAPLTTDGRGGVTSTLTLKRGERTVFALRPLRPGEVLGPPLLPAREAEACRGTVAFWRHWLARCTYTGRWREDVRRSALLLKLLTYEPTGAIVAAPTTSLPEHIGGARNWDYRYSWIRDAAFTLYGLLRVGFTEEVRDFIGWLGSCTHADPGASDDEGPLQIVYGIDGRRNLPEKTLAHLHGYRGSTPVRVGNGAAGQLQLDIYGELLDALDLYDRYATPIPWDLWQDLTGYLDWVCRNWERPDEGIWEVRGPKRHFVYSKLMCWTALDRGLRIADRRSRPAPRKRWVKTRDRIARRILAEGWSDQRQAFVQSFGDLALDASNLLMPMVGFLGPNDPRMLATLDATLRPPEEGGLTTDCLVWRYNLDEVNDGVAGDREGAFNLCTFWLVEALARAGHTEPERLEAAHIMFEKMLGYANHLGLFAEMTGLSGQALGNAPQAFSHLGLISAAYNLDRAMDAHQDQRRPMPATTAEMVSNDPSTALRLSVDAGTLRGAPGADPAARLREI